MIGTSKIWENGAKGLYDVSISIKEGEFVFIVGSSGSGKTSFVRLLLKEIEPTKGKIIIDGKDVSRISRRDLPYFRRKLGVVFQDFRLLKNKTVYENVAFAMRIVEATNKEIRRTVPQVLSLVGLAKKAKAYPHQLSGGEQQRVSLARAIINKPPILIADEPTGNLDPDTAWEIMTLLEDINNLGTTVVVATHARDIVDDMQKRVVVLGDGKVLGDTKNSGYALPPPEDRDETQLSDEYSEKETQSPEDSEEASQTTEHTEETPLESDSNNDASADVTDETPIESKDLGKSENEGG